MGFVLLTLIAALPVLADNSTCYYPNGIVDKTAIPCGNGNSMCCPQGFMCVDNGLCYHEQDSFYYGRYSCTNSNWDDTCPKNCVISQNGNDAAKRCGDGSWCCNFNEPEKAGGLSCCDITEEDRQSFNFGTGKIFALITGGKAKATTASLGFRPVSSRSSDGDTSTSTTAEPTATPNVVAGPPQFTSRDRTAWAPPSSTLETSATPSTGDASPTATSSSAANIGEPEATQQPASAAKVGIAVGVPCAVVAIMVVSWLLWHKRKRQLAIQNQSTPFDFDVAEADEKTAPTAGLAVPQEKDRTSKVPSEIDSREIRIPIHPQDTAYMASVGSHHLERDQTTHTLYPNAQPNYHAVSPPLPTSTSASTVFSHPSQAPDYSEWAVTPRLQREQRWSGIIGRNEDTGSPNRSPHGMMTVDGDVQGSSQAVEIMGHPHIPPTIHELP